MSAVQTIYPGAEALADAFDALATLALRAQDEEIRYLSATAILDYHLAAGPQVAGSKIVETKDESEYDSDEIGGFAPAYEGPVDYESPTVNGFEPSAVINDELAQLDNDVLDWISDAIGAISATCDDPTCGCHANVDEPPSAVTLFAFDGDFSV